MNIQRLINKRVLIEQTKEEVTTAGGIIISEEQNTAMNGHTRHGKVLLSNVDDIPVGVVAYYSRFVGIEYEDYLILEEDDVLAIDDKGEEK